MIESRMQHLKTVVDERGALTVAETGADLPFAAERFFIVHGVPRGMTRGFHAHRTCHQFLIATSGSVDVALDDGVTRTTIRLDHLSQGLHIPPMIWGEQTYLSDDAVLMVLTSDRYDRADYISDYAEFVALAGVRP
jgi:UDP-2-acetamido-3-amino-2,3-dideoxy-glucuronate N-acetyltransferase